MPITFQNITINKLSLVVPVNSLVNIIHRITLERLKILFWARFWQVSDEPLVSAF